MKKIETKVGVCMQITPDEFHRKRSLLASNKSVRIDTNTEDCLSFYIYGIDVKIKAGSKIELHTEVVDLSQLEKIHRMCSGFFSKSEIKYLKSSDVAYIKIISIKDFGENRDEKIRLLAYLATASVEFNGDRFPLLSFIDKGLTAKIWREPFPQGWGNASAFKIQKKEGSAVTLSKTMSLFGGENFVKDETTFYNPSLQLSNLVIDQKMMIEKATMELGINHLTLSPSIKEISKIDDEVISEWKKIDPSVTRRSNGTEISFRFDKRSNHLDVSIPYAFYLFLERSRLSFKASLPEALQLANKSNKMMRELKLLTSKVE